jgi:hypothetical protein
MSLSNYATNMLQDFWYRKQPITLPDNFYVALCSTVSSASAKGTEFSTGNYARVPYERSLVNFSGTQGQGTTDPSNGTSGIVYNNNQIVVGTPDVPWGLLRSICLMDQLTGGNMLEYYNLAVPEPINTAGVLVIIPINKLIFTSTSSSS